MPAPRNGIYNPYQVKAEDKDFLTLSANLAAAGNPVSYQDLVAANPFVQSLSQGQNINIPGPAPSGGLNTFGLQRPMPANRTPQLPALTGGASANATLGLPVGSNAPVGYGPYWQGSQSGSQQIAGIAQNSGNPSAMSAFRQSEYIMNQVTALDQYFQANGYLPKNIPSDVMAAMIAQGANPAQIKQLQQNAPASTGAASDPLAGTPGHYYIDETTAPFVNRIITVNGKRRILRQDKDGRLYYQKPGQSRRGRALNRQRRREAAAAAAAQVATPQLGNMTTALSVVLGS